MEVCVNIDWRKLCASTCAQPWTGDVADAWRNYAMRMVNTLKVGMTADGFDGVALRCGVNEFMSTDTRGIAPVAAYVDFSVDNAPVYRINCEVCVTRISLLAAVAALDLAHGDEITIGAPRPIDVPAELRRDLFRLRASAQRAEDVFTWQALHLVIRVLNGETEPLGKYPEMRVNRLVETTRVTSPAVDWETSALLGKYRELEEAAGNAGIEILRGHAKAMIMMLTVPGTTLSPDTVESQLTWCDLALDQCMNAAVESAETPFNEYEN